MTMKLKITNNQRNQRFEIIVGDHMAELVYRLRNDKIFLMHTWVPSALEGNGIASAMAEYALNYAKTNELQTVVYCPFVKSYIAKHKKWQ